MPFLLVAALVAAGSVAWAYTRFKSTQENRKANLNRARNVSQVAEDACKKGDFLPNREDACKKGDFLPNRPYEAEEPYTLSDARLKIDRG